MAASGDEEEEEEESFNEEDVDGEDNASDDSGSVHSGMIGVDPPAITEAPPRGRSESVMLSGGRDKLSSLGGFQGKVGIGRQISADAAFSGALGSGVGRQLSADSAMTGKLGQGSGLARQTSGDSDVGRTAGFPRHMSLAGTPGSGKLPGTSASQGVTQALIRNAEKRIARLEKQMKSMKAQEARVKNQVKGEVEKVLQEAYSQNENIEHLNEKLAELGQVLTGCNAEIAEVDGKVRSEKHRLHHVVVTNAKTEDKVESLSGKLVETQGGFKGIFERVTQSLQSMAKEIGELRSENGRLHGEIADARDRAGKASDDIIAGYGEELLLRLRDTLETQRSLLSSHQYLERQVQDCVRKDQLSRLDGEVRTFVDQHTTFEKYVTDQMFCLNKERGLEIVESWSTKRSAKARKRICAEVLYNWREYIRRRGRIREALGRTQYQYAKRHTTEWVRTWWYVMQKYTNAREFSKLAEENHSQNVQLEMLLATLHRLEKKSAETTRTHSQRMLAIEKSIDAMEEAKVNKYDIQQSFAQLEARLDRDFNLQEVKGQIEELATQLKVVDHSKYSAQQGQLDREAVEDLATEIRGVLGKHKDHLGRCASIENVMTKADAKLVEQVFVLLAQQADQLATLLSADLSHIKRALAKFLELSPDIRKAALSVGLDPNEECMSCRQLKRKMIIESGIGSDGNAYRLIPELAGQAMPEQARKILGEKLGFPTALESSLAAGNTLQAQQAAHGESTRVTSSETQNKLRGLLNASPGWLAGGPQTTWRPQKCAEQEAVPKGLFPAVGNSERTPRTGLFRPVSSKRSSSGLGGAGGEGARASGPGRPAMPPLRAGS